MHQDIKVLWTGFCSLSLMESWAFRPEGTRLHVRGRNDTECQTLFFQNSAQNLLKQKYISQWIKINTQGKM